jgi:tetratricopeptide (TPR) repeat protein
MSRLLLLLSLLAALGASAAPKKKPAGKQDLASQGFAEYQDGNYAKAVALLRKAVQQSPKNAYAWFNLGRATVANGQQAPAGDECNEETAWKYLAMKAFNRAVALEHEDMLGKVKADPKLCSFARLPSTRSGSGPRPRRPKERPT